MVWRLPAATGIGNLGGRHAIPQLNHAGNVLPQAWLVDYPLHCAGDWRAQLLDTAANYAVAPGSFADDSAKASTPTLKSLLIKSGFVSSQGALALALAAALGLEYHPILLGLRGASSRVATAKPCLA